MSRMAQTFIGVAVYIICSSLIFPVSARANAVALLQSIFVKLSAHHDSVFELQRRIVQPTAEDSTDEVSVPHTCGTTTRTAPMPARAKCGWSLYKCECVLSLRVGIVRVRARPR